MSNLPVTPEKLRVTATQAELRGDWVDAELLNAAADRLIALEAQNQAYRHSLQNGVSIKIIGRKSWFRRD